MLSIMGVPGGLLLILVLQINTGSTSGAVVCGYNVCPLGMDCINGIKCADPCDHYTALHDEWRSTNNTVNQVLHCDQYVNWQGWYRLFLGQTSAHIPERCVAENRCGTHAPLWITEPHPTQSNEIVNRTVCNAWSGSCCRFRSHIIQVKLCYGNYYVYKLVKPSNCHLAYCAEVNRTEPAVASTTSDPRPQSSTFAHPPTSTRSVPSSQTVQFNCEYNVCPLGMDCINGTSCADPCDHYTALHDEWRSTNNTGNQVLHCDQYVNWQGWYRLFLGQTSADIPERCVAENRCGTHAPLWITEPHPTQYNKIVNRTVCNAWLGSCCHFPSHIIQVKLCYGNYYVYKLVKPSVCHLAYCAEVNRTEPAVASTTSDPRPQSSTIAHPPTSTRSVPSAQTLQFNCEHNVCPLGMDCINGTSCANPCDHYTALHDEWRSTNNTVYQSQCDRNVNWQGWYRLFLGQTSAHIPERCVAENRCGTHAPLWITEPHPAQYNEIVNRTVCNAWLGSCCYFPSHIIQVKLCYGNYYVYKLVKPSVCQLAYCAEVNRTEPAVASTTSDPRPQSSTIAHPPTSTRSVPSAQTLQFNCEHNVCPLGMDCINGTGCADPCDHYTALHDEWRSTNYAVHQGLHCDRNVNWQGWYRLFLGQTSAHIPERCVAENRCGTHAPLWITEPHPAQYNEIVNRTVCNAWSGSCCRFRSHIIQVKLCYGNYYVYKLVKPSNCHLAYCAVQHHPLRPSQLICGRDKLQVGLDLASMTSSGFNPFTGNLAARNCSSFRVLDGVVWYEVEAKAGPCGNTLTTNHTHAIYSNTLFIYPMDNTSFAVPVSLPFSCAYPLETNTSLNVAVRPFLEHGGISGSGAKVRASMFLFRNSTYTKTYPAGQITLPVGSPLYVGVYVDEKDTNFAAVLEDCYATHSSNPDDPVRYSLIQNKCPTDRRQVSVVESGSSLRARFSALFFLPQGEYRDVFLHCSLRLCDQRSSLCVPSCTRRARRSLSTSAPNKPLTIGPIMWDKSPE